MDNKILNLLLDVSTTEESLVHLRCGVALHIEYSVSATSLQTFRCNAIQHAHNDGVET